MNIDQLGKDPNFLILNSLDDRELVNICQTNKFYQNLCNDQMFWVNRIFTKFPQLKQIQNLKKYKGTKIDPKTKQERDRTWSEYYIEDLRPKYIDNYYYYDALSKGRLDKIIIALPRLYKNDLEKSLGFAANAGQLDVVKYLVSIGADIHTETEYPLRTAAEEGHLDIVKYLVSVGADIHARNDWAVNYAHINGQDHVVEYLVSLGARLQTR